MDTSSHASHDQTLWYLLTGTRGGPNRARIVRELADKPRNANRLAAELDVGYKTVRHHLETLQEHGLVESGGDDYGKLYFVTDRLEREWDTFERIAEEIDE
jgi:DNA-binding transcriptional ArsR family regulator